MGPSIKGSTIGTLVEDVRKARDQGRISRARLEHRLEPADLELLEAEVSPAKWYPIESYRRLAECLLELDGNGRPEYLEARGARSARRLIAVGVYQQLDHLSSGGGGNDRAFYRRLPRAQQIKEFGRQLRLISSLSGTILNFGKWSVEPDPDHDDRFQIEIREAEAFPEVLIPTIAGFFNEMSEHSDKIGSLRWSGTRERPELIVFRMDRGVPAILDS